MRETFLGCPIDLLTMAETVERARDAMCNRKRLHHVALNVAKLVNMRTDLVLADDVAGSDIVGLDGMGIVWGARCLGIPATTRVSGVDLLVEVLAVCAKEGFRPYFLGATREILDLAVRRTQDKYPEIKFAGWHDGYFSAAAEAQVVADIRSSRADCLFIGMPTPRKERFLAAHRDDVDVSFIMGVGGSFDIIAGRTRRAPVTVQRLGLEWLYRIYQEPRRMWWRYLRTNSIFAGIISTEILRRGVLAVSGVGRLGSPKPTRGGR
ncbi:WecB/TagA/CpsF family glycosyltransferase [Rhodopseudomonas sp. P2A-2r]|uniref:WecB/TagA/CpsF family glycosyltransferase n=1 Tax=unclassified Rhodopseudomonas TaxID=2638247 RepID=UPI00223467F7|nr:WecB/TagA/CpsF family glycosyltransferase [Rhodopseudomonas sp. P2A-2r]UZE48043.1 WecB/TagA/CpsF family glycosyltransferase [Rhodopseudomonas sp. P2A-2r]